MLTFSERTTNFKNKKLTYFEILGLSQKTSTLIYREFLPNANFITANFVTAVFQNYYYNLANAILWAIYFVSAFISKKFG
jgi:hypothetical protein